MCLLPCGLVAPWHDRAGAIPAPARGARDAPLARCPAHRPAHVGASLCRTVTELRRSSLGRTAGAMPRPRHAHVGAIFAERSHGLRRSSLRRTAGAMPTPTPRPRGCQLLPDGRTDRGARPCGLIAVVMPTPTPRHVGAVSAGRSHELRRSFLRRTAVVMPTPTPRPRGRHLGCQGSPVLAMLTSALLAHIKTCLVTGEVSNHGSPLEDMKYKYVQGESARAQGCELRPAVAGPDESQVTGRPAIFATPAT
jgi:hypothetical protein